MGIRNFTKFINEAKKVGLVRTVSTINETPQVLMIDLVSSFYGILKQWQNEDGIITEHEKAVECAFKRLIIYIPYEKLLEMNEIFIAVDIVAPIMKEKTQFKRRQTDEKNVLYSDRLVFYELFVKYLSNVMRDTNVKITFAKTINENYRSAIGYEMGEGEYIVFVYIHQCIKTNGFTQFLVIGNDNDIPLYAIVFNTVYEHRNVCVRYMSVVDSAKNTVAWSCPKLTYLMCLLFRISVLGNDYIPNIVSGTEMQITKLCTINVDELNETFESLANFIFKRDNLVINQQIEITTFQYIKGFSLLIYESLKTIATQSYLQFDDHNFNSIVNESSKYVNGFIIVCMWYFLYIINLFDSSYSSMYDKFGIRILHETNLKINSFFFIEAMNINGGSGLKFHIDRLYTMGKLQETVESILATLFINSTNIV